MKSGDTDAFGAATVFDFNPATRCERQFELRNLVAFGKIGIKIVLAGKTGVFVDGAVEGQSGTHAQFHDALIQDWQSTGQPQTYWTNVGIWCIAKAIGATAKNLGLGKELRVNFQADDHLVFGEEFGR